MQFQKPKGTVDYFPEERARFNYIVGKLREVAGKYNFSEIETPAFEELDLLTRKSGDEIVSQLFTLEKRGEEQFGLRFDLTVPFTRMFIEKQKELSKPVKWFAISRMWRYEAPQKGRLREFYQLSAELYGSDKPEADAEIINCLIDCFKALGFTSDDIVVKINNRRLLQGLMEEIVKEDKVEDMIKTIDKLGKISDKEFEDKVVKIEEKLTPDLIKFVSLKGKPSEVIPEIEKMKLTQRAKHGLDEIKKVTEPLKENEEFIVLDLSIARGLAYYTGTVFEVFDKKGALRSLAGGGRYDNLVGIFGGTEESATGFAIGLETTSILMEEKGLFPKEKPGPDYYVAPVNDSVRKDALDIANKLRKNNSVEIDLMARKLGKQMEYADAINAKKAVIVGPDELANGEVVIKDFSSGKEEKVKIEDLK